MILLTYMRMSKRADAFHPSVRATQEEKSMAITKRGKYWHYEFMIDGQKYRGTTKETVKSRANTFESLLIAEIRTTGSSVNLRRAPVLRDFATRFLQFVDAQTVSGQLDLDTKRYYHGGWKLLEGTRLAGMRIDQIGTSDAAVLTFPHSASNANRAFRTLRRMLNMAVEWKLLRAAPKIKELEELGRTALVESSTEALLLKHASQPLADVLVIMMDCGMRPEEAMRMRKEHVFWDRSVVLVPYGKSFKSKRYVPLSDRIRKLLRLRESGDSPWVFPSKRAKCGHLTTLAKQWTATVEAVNLAAAEQKLPPISPNLKLYCARHTFATDMLAEGMNLAEVKELMGHEDVKTTMKYLHPDTSGSAAVVNQRNHSKLLHLLKATG
jgi:integrase